MSHCPALTYTVLYKTWFHLQVLSFLHCFECKFLLNIQKTDQLFLWSEQHCFASQQHFLGGRDAGVLGYAECILEPSEALCLGSCAQGSPQSGSCGFSQTFYLHSKTCLSSFFLLFNFHILADFYLTAGKWI